MSKLVMLLLLGTLLCVPACSQTTQTAGTEAACVVWRPITYSSRDTPETVLQVLRNNAAQKSWCSSNP